MAYSRLAYRAYLAIFGAIFVLAVLANCAPTVPTFEPIDQTTFPSSTAQPSNDGASAHNSLVFFVVFLCIMVYCCTCCCIDCFCMERCDNIADDRYSAQELANRNRLSPDKGLTKRIQSKGKRQLNSSQQAGSIATSAVTNASQVKGTSSSVAGLPKSSKVIGRGSSSKFVF